MWRAVGGASLFRESRVGKGVDGHGVVSSLQGGERDVSETSAETAALRSNVFHWQHERR